MHCFKCLDVYIMGNKSQRPTVHLLDVGLAIKVRFGQIPLGS